jgi:hypothetical protein
LNYEKMDAIEEAFAEFADTAQELEDARAFVLKLQRAGPGDSVYDEVYAEFKDEDDPVALVRADLNALVS